jgi:hypothetical protein
VDRLWPLTPEDPVAINPKHHVLAAGDYRFNVLSV